MLKLLDFWAPWCIDPQTSVLTENGYLKASQIKVGDKLITIDPKTYHQVIQEVERVRTFKNAPSKKVLLETGRVLVGDSNHRVLTQEGFKALGELKMGEKVLVNPSHISTFESTNNTLIVETTGNDFSDKVLKNLDL